MTATFKKNIRSRLAETEIELLRSIEEQHREYAELTMGDRTDETDEAAIRNEERALSALLHHDRRGSRQPRSADHQRARRRTKHPTQNTSSDRER